MSCSISLWNKEKQEMMIPGTDIAQNRNMKRELREISNLASARPIRKKGEN